MTTEIKIIEKKIAPIVKNALALEINNEFDLGTGVEILSELNRFQDRITEEKEKITKPLNEALKVERARWKPLEKMYEEGIDSIRSKMSAYQTEAMNKQAKAEEEMAQAVVDGTVDMDKAVSLLDKTVDTQIKTPLGSVTFRQTQFLKLTDVNLIPKEYFDLNEKKVLDALKAGVVVPGAEIEIRSVPVNYR